MSRLRTLVIGGALAALAASAIAMPVGAADTQGTLAIVNGRPGGKVDVCLNGKEIKSGLAYGASVSKDVVSTGNKTLKFYAADPRKCKGTLRGQESFLLAPAGDWTIVLTKNAPKVVLFNNTGLGEIPPAGAPLGVGIIVFRHAAETINNFFVRYWAPIADTPIAPAANPLWAKGQQFPYPTQQDWIWQLRVTRPENPNTVALRKIGTEVSRRYELIFVGSNAQDAKIVLVNRRISAPSP